MSQLFDDYINIHYTVQNYINIFIRRLLMDLFTMYIQVEDHTPSSIWIKDLIVLIT